jgi:hypothetical protein
MSCWSSARLDLVREMEQRDSGPLTKLPFRCLAPGPGQEVDDDLHVADDPMTRSTTISTSRRASTGHGRKAPLQVPGYQGAPRGERSRRVDDARELRQSFRWKHILTAI